MFRRLTGICVRGHVGMFVGEKQVCIRDILNECRGPKCIYVGDGQKYVLMTDRNVFWGQM